MTQQTYTNRKTVNVTITDVDPVKHDAWFSNTPPPQLAAVVQVGDTVAIESTPNGRISGWLHNNVWYNRLSDQQIEAEQQQFYNNFAAQQQTDLDANREDWQERTNALPEWVKCRLDFFEETAGEKYRLEGWGYELLIAELAVLLKQTAEAPNFFVKTSEQATQFCFNKQMSDNQVKVAEALARHHHSKPDDSLAGTVSAFTPLTGEPYYLPTK